jgi:hypothetical protein
MIYAVKKMNDNSYKIVNTKYRKPTLAVCIIVFVFLCGFYPILAILFLGVIILAQITLRNVSNEVLKFYYASAKEPIVLYQLSENDNTLHLRHLEIVEMLIKSDNVLYKNGFLKVYECYYKEQNVLENWNQYLIRLEKVKSEAMQDMLNNVSHDKIWTKKYMFGQMISDN